MAPRNHKSVATSTVVVTAELPLITEGPAVAELNAALADENVTEITDAAIIADAPESETSETPDANPVADESLAALTDAAAMLPTERETPAAPESETILPVAGDWITNAADAKRLAHEATGNVAGVYFVSTCGQAPKIGAYAEPTGLRCEWCEKGLPIPVDQLTVKSTGRKATETPAPAPEPEPMHTEAIAETGLSLTALLAKLAESASPRDARNLAEILDAARESLQPLLPSATRRRDATVVDGKTASGRPTKSVDVLGYCAGGKQAPKDDVTFTAAKTGKVRGTCPVCGRTRYVRNNLIVPHADKASSESETSESAETSESETPAESESETPAE